MSNSNFERSLKQTNTTDELTELTLRLEHLVIEKASIEERIRTIKSRQRVGSKAQGTSKTTQSKVKRVIPIPSKYTRFIKRICHDCDHNRIRIGDRVEFITHAAHQPREGIVAYFTEFRITVEDDKGYKYSKESCSLRVIEE